MTIITVYCHYYLGCFMTRMIKTSIYIKAARDTATIITTTNLQVVTKFTVFRIMLRFAN